ncbi:MAG: ATPase domain-containing protein [Chthoniobacteraceae bacterium]
MNDLIKTGIDGLDDILFGGVRQGNILLVEGSAGAGKTTLGLEFIYRGIVENDEPGLIVTFELSPAKLLRDAAGFGWDLRKLEDEGRLKMVYTSPLVLLQELHSHDGLLMQEIRRFKAKRLLLDGLTPLKLFGELFNGRPFRDSLHLLVETLQREEITAMLTREVPESEQARSSEFSHEQFVCDTILTLRSDFVGRNRVRSLTVAKSRGQDYVAGRHTLRIEAGRGVRIYPRAQSRARVVTDQPTSTKRSSLGMPALDEMIGKGVYDGSATLVVGVSGTGKTVVGVTFLVEGARQGKPGLLVTLDEHPAQIMRNAEGLDLPLKKFVDEKLLHFFYDSPQELELDVHYDRITRLVEEHKIERVLIDSLAAYMTSEDRIREFHDFIYALTTFFKDRLVTAFMNYESPELLGVSQISEEIKASTIVDNIILLNYVEFSDRLRRAITVPKARGTAPSRVTREYRITKGGIQLEPHDVSDETESVPQLPFSAYYGVLARSPARRSPLIDEQIQSGNPASDAAATPPPARSEKSKGPAHSAPAGRKKKAVRKQ